MEPITRYPLFRRLLPFVLAASVLAPLRAVALEDSAQSAEHSKHAQPGPDSSGTVQPAPDPTPATRQPSSDAQSSSDPQPQTSSRRGAPREEPTDPCLDLDEDSGVALDALSRLRLSSDGKPRLLREVRFTGLRTLDERQLWRLVGRKPQGPMTTAQASAVVIRMAESGLFRTVEPRLHVAGEDAYLELQLQEFPRVESVDLRGLTEVSEREVLRALLRPLSEHTNDLEDEGEVGAHVDHDDDDRSERKSRTPRASRADCPSAISPGRFLARLSGDKVVPGIIRGGMAAALNRVMEALRDDGYLMASLQAELSADGRLVLEVDEGRLERLELHGVPETLKVEILAELDLQQGRVFAMADVEAAVEKVKRKYPFLEEGEAKDSRRAQSKVVEAEEGERRVYRTEEGQGPRSPRSRRVKVTVEEDGEREAHELHIPDEVWDWDWDWNGRSDDSVAVEGHTARLYFEQDRTDLDTDWLELLRHTPVTGFAPGLGLTGWLYDPENRAHLGVDAQLSLNTSRPSQPVDYLVGPKVQIPALGIAELGGQLYALTDTPDRWRVSRIDSYLHSMLLSHPHADYHRRTGVSAFVTTHWARQLTLGAEYRNDIHGSMDTVVGPSFLVRDVHLNPAVDAGRMGSMTFRAEWSTRKAGLEDVGRRRRAPELSLVDRDWYGELEPGFQTVNTVEVADPRLGGTFNFVRVISDNGFHLRTGDDQGLRLRMRAAGGRDLPAQKREALGGWNALRGYDFKEFQGDFSLLAMAEYHFGFFSAFADGGTVHSATGWLTPKVGVGAAVNLGSHFQVAAAWRTDERARLLPEFKAVLNRTF